MIKKLIILIVSMFFLCPLVSFATVKDEPNHRLNLYYQIETETGLSWSFIAAIDQYERSLRLTRKDRPEIADQISIYFPDEIWAGAMNPNHQDTNPQSIAFFEGVGVDGDGDGVASRSDDRDVLQTMVNYLANYGFDRNHFKIALWNYYKRDRAVSIIMHNAEMFDQFKTIELQKKAFPVSLNSHYTYKDTWGMSRGWGGKRTHEGTDIFADYGTPVRSTCYGVIEVKGWNKYGGWRLGIRDINNTYHYFAHLNSFAKGLHIGQLVEPGQVIGGVGSSGYGKVGTSGKFPPHLHYGMYKDDGTKEWSFNPYPFLRIWEKEES